MSDNATAKGVFLSGSGAGRWREGVCQRFDNHDDELALFVGQPLVLLRESNERIAGVPKLLCVYSHGSPIPNGIRFPLPFVQTGLSQTGPHGQRRSFQVPVGVLHYLARDDIVAKTLGAGLYDHAPPYHSGIEHGTRKVPS